MKLSTSIKGCLMVALLAFTAAAADPPRTNSFGIKPEWVTSPAMQSALEQLQKAGIVKERRGSLTFFRWSTGEPPRLAHLGLWGPQITNELLVHAKELPDLEFVSLYETNIDDDGVQRLARLPKLRRLTIAPICRYEKAGFGAPQWSYPFMSERADRPRITGRGLKALGAVSTLEALELLDARLTTADLALLQSWPKLSAIALPNTMDADAVAHLRACRRLNQLTLGYREVTAAELKQLAAWSGLRHLTLIHARLSNEALAALGELQTVEELQLEDCGLTDERLSYLRLGAQTKSLSLGRNEITGPGLAQLAKLKPIVLGLEFNNLADDTLDHLPQLTSVTDLQLAYCRNITDRGLRGGLLQKMTHVKRLNLRGLKQVTDAALNDLEQFRHLEHIGLRETSVSVQGIARLKEVLSQTEVFK